MHQLLLVGGLGLAVVIAATVFSRRTGIAAPLLLVALGIAAASTPWVPDIEVEPELVLAGVLPPLLYSSSLRLPVIDLRRNLGMITWLSVVIVVASAFAVGAAVHLCFPQIPFPLAVALGAVVSPTDAVAATSIGKRLGLPNRLMTVLEGESLVNDATALVLLRVSLAALAGSFSLGQAVLDFAVAVVGAVLVGLAVAWVTILVRQRLADPVLTTLISFAVPFLAFAPAEAIGASGVLAVVVAGIVTGHVGPRRFPARDRQAQAIHWATISFALESGVFLLMGLELPALLDAAREESSVGTVLAIAGVALLVTVVLRVLGVFAPVLVERRVQPERNERVRAHLAALENRLDAYQESYEPQSQQAERRVQHFQRRLARGTADVDFQESHPITRRGGVVLAWSGMRGVVTLAAAQTIPINTEHRATLVLVAFVVALVTLVGFGGSLPWLIRRLDFPEVTPDERRDEFTALMRTMLTDASAQLGPLDKMTVDGQPIDSQVVQRVNEQFVPVLLGRLRGDVQPKPGVREQLVIIQRRYVDALRDALNDERSIGAYRSETYAAVQAILDREEQRLDPQR
jgi:CPA1 family monovalent cation:H+ antiporter